MEKLCNPIEPLCYTCTEVDSALPISVSTILTPSTTYYVFVNDKFAETYMAEIQTTITGELIIDESDFPNLFNPHSGFFTIWIADNESGTPRIELDDNNINCVTYHNICE